MIDNHIGGSTATLDLRRNDGVQVTRRELSGTWTQGLELPPGDYTATITDAAGGVTRRAIRLGAEGARLTIPGP